MRSLIFCFLLVPFLALSQNDNNQNNTNSDNSQQEYLLVNTQYFSPKADKMTEFMDGLKTHNSKFHSEGGLGVRIYNVLNGDENHRFVAVMGPFKWSEMDEVKSDTWEEHQQDWYNNVAPYLANEGANTFWRFHNDLSHFPPNFDINKLEIITYDVARMQGDKMQEVLKKAVDVMKQKYPELPFGIYTNEFSSTKEGRDMAIAYFFNDFKWLSDDPAFKKNYEEVNGQGSFDQFRSDWQEVTNGSQSEIWIFNSALSGIGSQVTTGSLFEKK